MSSTAGGGSTQTGPANDVADRLGLSQGMVVQELGWDSDTDDELRVAVEDAIDADMVDGDYGNVVDAGRTDRRSVADDHRDGLQGLGGHPPGGSQDPCLTLVSRACSPRSSRVSVLPPPA